MPHLARLVESLAAGPQRPVEVHIERLVLSGLPLTQAQSHRLGAAVTAELERLARAPGWPMDPGGRALPVAIAPAVTVASDPRSPTALAALGRDIARSVYLAVREAR